MPLTIRLENEQGKVKKTVIDKENILTKLTDHVDVSDTCCLQYIDPYGNTTFNYLQCKALIEEIELIEDQKLTAEEKKLLQTVLNIARQCNDERHHYIQIYGD